MLFLSSITASSGSTGGGIRIIRTLILARQAHREMTLLLHPYAIRPFKIKGRMVPNKVVFSVLAFVFMYFMSVVIMSFILIASGLDFISSFTAVIACINNAGPDLGKVGPATNYAALTDFQTWVCTLTILLGRLEVFSLVIIFTPAFWRR
jgi:trk/ktr system potassium uptake protein